MSDTLKYSTVLVSTGNRLSVYGSVEEVPLEIRRKFLDRSPGLRTATILIADKNGRERLLRNASAESGDEASPSVPPEEPSARKAWPAIRPWVEAVVLCAFGAAMWALFTLR